MRKLRLTLLGVLCAGLLLGGVGVGVGMAEFSAFTYAGERLIEGAEARTQTFTVQLESDAGTVKIADRLDYHHSMGLSDMIRLEVSDTVPEGTLLLEFAYETVGPEPTFWTNFYADQDLERVSLGWTNRSDLQVLLACKDQVLSDIRAHRLGDYIPARPTGIVVTVNSADADRVSLLS